MSPNTQNNLSSQPQPKHSTNGSRLIYKCFISILLMASFAVLSFTIAVLIKGGPAHLTFVIKNLLTSDVPKLTLNVGSKEKKIKALPEDLAKELMTQLTQLSDNPIAMAALDAKQESPIMNKLNKTDYIPVQLKALQAPGQSISFKKQPSQLKLFLHYNNKDILANTLDPLIELNPSIDGPCYVLLESYWAAEKSWQTDRRGLYFFIIDFDRPAQFELSATELEPGELLLIYAKYLKANDKIAVQSDLPISLQFTPYGNQELVALVPLSYDLPAGEYTTTLSIGDTNQKFVLTIKDKEFPILLLASEKENEALNEKGIIEFKEKILPILDEQEPNLLWNGSTQVPIVDAPITSYFGSRLCVDNQAISTRNPGIDIAAPHGTPVMAINSGKVIFSGKLIQSGNTPIIEHGLGLKSWYYHLDNTIVEEGTLVSKGDVIGKVGNNTDHIHLNLSVNGTYINPETAFKTPLFR